MGILRFRAGQTQSIWSQRLVRIREKYAQIKKDAEAKSGKPKGKMSLDIKMMHIRGEMQPFIDVHMD